MKEQKILEQLNKLKSIKPDAKWKNSNRDILHSQIFSSQVEEEKQANIFLIAINNIFNFTKSISQPTLTMAIIILVVMGSWIGSSFASKNANLGDSLYIAKIINEKAQFAFTFNEKKKVKLGIEFATNRVEEINNIIKEKNKENKNKDEKVKKLVSDFKRQINETKSRLKKIETTNKIAGKNQENKEETEKSTEEIADEENIVFSANLSKDENGIQVSEPNSVNSTTESTEPVIEENLSSTTEEVIEKASTTESIIEEKEEEQSPQTILEQAEVLLDKEDYNATIDKLNQADDAINNIDSTKEETTTTETEEEIASTSDEIK